MKPISLLLILLLLLSGCSGYKTQYTPFRPPEGYANYHNVDNVSVGGEAYANKKAAEKAFGFDIRGAGVLPVMLVLDNKSGQSLEIVSGQSFLLDDGGNYWPVIPNDVAFRRIERSSQFAHIAKGTGKGAVVGAAIGGLLATALGVVSGQSVAEYLAKGAAMGGASGAVVGGAYEAGSSEIEYRISSDLREKGLDGKVVPDQYLANGFLFFPGEAKSARALRLQWKERESGTVRTVILPLAGVR